MGASKALAVLLFASLSLASSVPSWVQPGVTAVYEAYSSNYDNGQHANAIATTMTLRVESVSGNTVTGTSYVESPVMPGYGQTYQWTCIEGGTCDWRFWVDPSNPTASVKGPHGEPYSIVGTGPYSHGTYSTQDATLMAYQNAQSGVEYHLTFERRTGLVLAYAEIYPSQRTYLYFKSVNADLSGYQPPQGGPLDGGGGSACPALFALLFAPAFAAAAGLRPKGF